MVAGHGSSGALRVKHQPSLLRSWPPGAAPVPTTARARCPPGCGASLAGVWPAWRDAKAATSCLSTRRARGPTRPPGRSRPCSAQASRSSRPLRRQRFPRAPSKPPAPGPFANPQGAVPINGHPTELLLQNTQGALPLPDVQQHLTACERCHRTLQALAPLDLDHVWQGVAAELDAPRPSLRRGLMLPDLPGEEVARSLRTVSRVAIIMLTAKAEGGDRWRGCGLAPMTTWSSRTLRRRLAVAQPPPSRQHEGLPRIGRPSACRATWTRCRW